MDTVLELNDIVKIYDNGVVANDGISMDLKKAEIHAITGENGAGKSTLMNIIFGEIQPTEGQVYLHGKLVNFQSPSHAIDLGIGMVHQHFKLVESLSVAQNVFLGIEPKKGVFIDYERMNNETKELAKKYNFKLNAKSRVRDISVGEKQKVEILKALARGAKILILDEPTAVLTPQETEELFEQLITFKEQGQTVVFISHKLDEVKRISDRITIIRKGKTVGTYLNSEISENEISRLMVGRDIIKHFEKSTIQAASEVLSIKNLSYRNNFGKMVINNLSLSLKGGEIVGVAGVEGNGQSDLVNIICGLSQVYEGEVIINGKDIKNKSIKQIRDLGLSHISEDRIHQGVALDATISENLISTKLEDKSIKNGIFFSDSKIKNLSEKLVEQFVVLTGSIFSTVRMLSGGNMQKVVIARELSSNPKFLVANQPTRGVDVGSAEFIYRNLLKLREEEVAVLMVSSDLNEILELSDKIVVMYGGEITGLFDSNKKVSEEELGYYMLGLKKDNILGGEHNAQSQN